MGISYTEIRIDFFAIDTIRMFSINRNLYRCIRILIIDAYCRFIIFILCRLHIKLNNFITIIIHKVLYDI